MEILKNIANHSSELISQMPYFWIFILMVVESSFIPFPSEVVMIPAWYYVATWNVNFVLALASWTFWSLLGAIINYIIWYYWWKALVKRLIWEKANDLCVNYFEKHWDNTTLIWRFLPWIRQIISLPAWVFKMDMTKFIIYTVAWAWIWCLMLMLFWYYAWENKELFFKYKYYFTLLAIFIAILTIYIKLKVVQYLQRNTKKVPIS